MSATPEVKKKKKKKLAKTRLRGKSDHYHYQENRKTGKGEKSGKVKIWCIPDFVRFYLSNF